MKNRLRLSVIIPVADGDDAWKELLPDLRPLAPEDEVIVSANMSLQSPLEIEAKKLGLTCRVQWTPSPLGRGKQLNVGARQAQNDFLWFLHGDSKLSPVAITELKNSLERKPNVIHYFDLRFLQDGPLLMTANSLGVWIRSHILGLPFGDQGFCMHRDVFAHLEGFSETAPYGEDHLLIWKAHQNRIRLNCVNTPLYTSARRYREKGWLKTTTRHLSLTMKQAAPELLRLLKGID